MADVKIPLEQLSELNVKLLSKEKLKQVSPGDWIDIDTLLQSLLHAGYTARYENIVSDSVGFWAVMYIDDEEFGAVEGSDMGHMVRQWGDL